MIHYFFYALVLLFCLILPAHAGLKSNTKPNHSTGKSKSSSPQASIESLEFQSKAESIESYIHSMSLEQKVGQLFIFGFSGQEITKSLKGTLRHYKPGAVIVFKRNLNNPFQIAKLNYTAQLASKKYSGLPLLIMIDQEGGVVSRIKTRPYAPSALSIGMTQNPSLSEQAGEVTGHVLNLLGFNMNLAPVVDISDPFDINFIGNRSFGGSPPQVKVMGHRFATGLQKAGILPTFKHFPGHGGPILDSHKSLPQRLVTEQELKKTDLVPFSQMIHVNFPGAIMVAHISFPNIDPSGMPATFSKVLVDNILRKKMNYKGIVITDDIEMHGAKIVAKVGDRAIKAIQAGCDMVMVAWTRKKQKQAYNALLKAVKNGRISEQRINESLRRILSVKISHPINSIFNEKPKLFKKLLTKNLNKLKLTSNIIAYQNLERAFFSQPKLKGLLTSKTRVMLFTADWSFFKSFKSGTTNRVKYHPLSPRKSSNLYKKVKSAPKTLVLYYVTGSGTAKILNRVPGQVKKQIIVINSTNPGMIKQRHLYKGIIDLNSRNYNSGKWIAQKMTPINRRLPSHTEKKISKRNINN